MTSNSHPQIRNHQPLSAKFQAKYQILRILLVPVFALVFTVPNLAQQSSDVKERPRSFSLNDNSQAQVDRKTLPPIDTQRLIEEDNVRGRDTKNPRPLRFAVARNVNFTLNNSGTWRNLSDGRDWRLRIQSLGAKNLNLGITRFDMPAGAKLWIYNPAHEHVQGPYTSQNRSHRGSLWTPVIEGEEIVVEVFVPTGVAQPVVEIRKVNHGYRGLVGIRGFSEGACEIDAICPEGNPWRDQIRSVGVYTIGGTGGCTGNMMNNTRLDRTPYVLSANHCGVNTGNDDTVVFYWNFESAVCGTHAAGPLDHNQTGAIFRASNAASDFLLFQLSAMPDAAFNVFYAGWDRRPNVIPVGTVVIHQPSVDVKAISFDNNPPIIAANLSDTSDPTATHWRTVIDSGIVERGSSGSCLFETTNGRCIGQLHSGDNGCPAGTSPHDWWGRFSSSWDGGMTNSTRLSNWLDPDGTGATTLDGDPHITTFNGVNYDFQGAGEYVSMRQGGMEVQTRMTPIATTFFPGPDGHDGLASCVSIISAVAMRIGSHRVTYQPNLSGVPDPSGMQLRIDGVVTTLGPAGIDLGGGGRILRTSAPGGLEIHYPNGHVSFVTPGFWSDQGKWFLYVDMDRTRAMDGADSGAATLGLSGLAGTVPPGSWLPRLPDGTSMGPMPASLTDRYNDLYQRFGGAWRVTDASSLFDYASGTSTATFTMLNWPLRNGPCVVPNERSAQPASEAVARRACSRVKNPNARRNCEFDVRVTGFTGFATGYIQSQAVLTGSTTTTTPNPTSTQNRWAVFADAGAGVPQGSFSTFFNTGFSFNAGLEYMATSNFSVEGIFGYHRFPSIFNTHANLYQLSGNAKFYMLPSPNNVRPFVNGGIGAYVFDSGTTRFGGNVGGGVLFEVTPRFGFQGSYNFHTVNTSGSALKFSTIQGGVRFVF